MKTMAKMLTEKLEIKDTDSEKAKWFKPIGQGALDGAITVGSVAFVLGVVKIIRGNK